MSNHEEWLSLIEVTGPFLTVPVLERVFPQGLDTYDQELAARIRTAHEEWTETQEMGGSETNAIHFAWVDFVLREALGFDQEVIMSDGQIPDNLRIEVSEHHEQLSPDYTIINPPGIGNEGKPRLLVKIWSPGQNLTGTVEGKSWSASPVERMTTLCRATDVRLGLITNGDRWMLVDAPIGETSGYASWYASLWSQEPLTLRAFQSLLCARRFFGVAEQDNLEALLTESVAYQQEVTYQLGTQVRQAVETLIQALDRADQDRGRILLKDVPPEQLYNAALTVMMRLVFLFCAEERGLLLLGDPVYDLHYAVSTLSGQLREEADRTGIEILEKRQDAWTRLLATFRGVYIGIDHDTLRLSPLDGSLFDPDRYPFLEGRNKQTSWKNTAATPLPIDNRTVLHLLESLQLLHRKGSKGPFEARRLSFRALDIEQIGHVYEGLLDHVAVRVSSPTIGLKGAQGHEPEISLDELEQRRVEDNQKLLDYLREQTRRSENALQNDLHRIMEEETRERLRIACGNDEELFNRLIPYYALIREDVWGYPVVYPAGSLIVTGGPERRETGTHYTPRSLTETIVADTLTPLVYDGPSQGKPRETWKIHAPEQLLDLKICDMAMGSGAFLVQVCRWLGERLVESWEGVEAQGKIILTDGTVHEEARGHPVLPSNRDERLIIAHRLVAERCIYGVDINPMSVELAKLSIWLVTMAKGRPCGFLDHNLRYGDSLFGVSNINQIRHFHMNPERGMKLHHSLFDPTKHIEVALQQALELRHKLRSVRVLDIEDVAEVTRLHQESREAITKVDIIANLLVGCYMASAGQSQATLEKQLVYQAHQLQQWLTGRDELRIELEREAKKLINTDCPERLEFRRPFHWPLEFPEVFDHGGFNVIIGNPPFMGGLRLSEVLGDEYNRYLFTVYKSTSRKADLCSYFFLRSFELTNNEALVGLLATNTISQGVTRRSSLDILLDKQCCIYSARKSFAWPGHASVIASLVHFSKGKWLGTCFCDIKPCNHINVLLEADDSNLGQPYRLANNQGICYQGATMWGEEFFIDNQQATEFLKISSQNALVVKPAIGGRELNTNPTVTPERWAINFGERKREEVEKFSKVLSYIERKLREKRSKLDRKKYERVVNEWWKYFHSRTDLFDGIVKKRLEKVLARSRVSDFHMLAFLDSGIIFTDALVVFLFDTYGHFCLLQSTIHDIWIRVYASTLKNDVRYVVTDCFETFPFPTKITPLESYGVKYYEHRSSIMLTRQEGLTDTYNRFHDPIEGSEDIKQLRELHVEMDQAVARVYGWNDLELGHSFYETRRGVRFTCNEAARTELIHRLLKLNHERYHEEVRQGLHS